MLRRGGSHHQLRIKFHDSLNLVAQLAGLIGATLGRQEFNRFTKTVAGGFDITAEQPGHGMVLMAGGIVGIQGKGTTIGIEGRGDVAFLAEHQAEVVPTQGHFRSPLRGGLGELDRFFELVVFHQ